MAKLDVEVSDNVVIGGVIYVKATDEAEVGDVIRIGAECSSYVTSGGFYTITHVESGEPRFEDDDGDSCGVNYLDENPAVYRAVKAPVKSADFNVGDYVKALPSPSRFREIGDILKVAIDDGSIVPYSLAHLDGSNGGWAAKTHITAATPEEIAAATKPKVEPKVEPLKVGDYVKYVNDDNHIEKGAILKITEDDRSEAPYRLAFVDPMNLRTPWASVDDVVPATDDEVADARRNTEAARKLSAKWVALGRKVNEFKNGDVVRFMESTGSYRYPAGSIAIIDSIDGKTFSFADGYGGHTDWIELIAPVESLFNASAAV